jgi:ATP-dependent DNA helicase DinG
MKWSGIAIASTFPISRRPIYIYPVASMTRKEADESQPLIAMAVLKIASLHPESKILVHTISYNLNKVIESYLDNSEHYLRTVTYHSSGEKQKAIDRYLYTPHSILLAPSLDRGIDLPDDDCRVIIVCKVPFPSLGDKQISTRLYSKGGQNWYAVRTIRSLVQMTGRGMRHESDMCETYILDSQFIKGVWRKNKHLLPSWWRDALVWDKGVL